jgi:hypothetical protein
MAGFIESYLNTQMVIGDNGTPAYVTMGLDYKSQLAEIFQWMRGTPDDTIRDVVNTFLESSIRSKNETAIQELFLLCLFIRDPRKGKGERSIIYTALLELYEYFPETTQFIIYHLKDYGYWGDFEKLWTLSKNNKLKFALEQFFAKALQEDRTKIDIGESPSLCAKWAPTEKSDPILSKAIARIIFPELSGSKLFQAYRKLLTSLRVKIDLVESHLCDGTTAEIKPIAIPSKAATLYSKALRNEKHSAWPKETRNAKAKPGSSHERFTLGHPLHEDRSLCKENITTFLANGGEMKAEVADLYRIVEEIFTNDGCLEDPIRQSQWDARLKEIQQKNQSLKAENPSYSHPNILSVVDLSGSMEGIQGDDKIRPIVAAIMLGLFTSQIQDTPLDEKPAPFANCFFGFSSEPTLFQLPRTSIRDPTKRATLVECIRAMRPYQSNKYWGQSTNLYKVFQVILENGLRQSLHPNQMPNIVAIYSDMEFDMADDNFNKTQHETLEQMYKTAGYEIPMIIYWDLNRSKQKKGYPVKANAPGTICLSGFSTRMLDLFLEASIYELSECCKVATTETDNDDIESSLTTLTLLEAALHHEMFDSTFREQLATCIKTEFIFKFY